MAPRTKLGKLLNEGITAASLGKVTRTVTKEGEIKECVGGRYSYKILLDEDNPAFGGDGRLIGPIDLDGLAILHAGSIGEPEMQVGQRVRISYSGPSAKRGTMCLVSSKSLVPGQKYEDASSSNQLAIKGTAFAPPGAGV